MSTQSQNTSKMQLESSVIRAFENYHRLAYAQIGPDLHIIQTSDNFSFLLQDGIETAEGQSLLEILDEFVGAEDDLRAVLNKKQEHYLLEFVNRKLSDGTRLYLNFRVVNLDTLSGEPGLLLIIEDVTTIGAIGRRLLQIRDDMRLSETKLNAANLELNRLKQFKSFLLSLLSHDMSTPLAAIRGYAELLVRLISTGQAEQLPTKAVGFSENILNITDQMTWLIRDIIDLNQSEKGLLTVTLENCDIHQAIQETLDMMNSIVKLQKITMSLDLSPQILLISADPQRMRQITNNLIGNAIKSTPSGGQISIQTYVKNEQAILTVADSGQGSTAEQIEKIFQPFYRIKESKSSNVLGSGLGLYIVKALVEAQNGRIEVVSEVGKGSKFTVYFPLVTVQPAKSV